MLVAMPQVPFNVDFYNVEVNRPMAEVKADLEAIARGGADVIVLVECVGYDLPSLDGYGKPFIRDRSTRSRANTAIYLANRHKPYSKLVKWHDMKVTWPRTSTPNVHGDMHEPRSWPELRVGGIQIFGVHQIQRFLAQTQVGQSEGIAVLGHRMMPTWTRPPSVLRPRLAIGDFNWPARNPSLHGPWGLAKAIRGRVVGIGIDCAVKRGRLRLKGCTYPTTVAGHTLTGDHHHMMRAKFTVPGRYLRKQR